MPDLQHQVWLLTLDGHLHKSPLPTQLKAILDIGTGNGTWAIAMAQAWPNATVIGTDLTPPHGQDVGKLRLANLRFQKDNADEDWDLRPKQFDFIHGRMLASGIHDWPGLLEKSFNHLSPGGSLELLDLCHPFRADVEQFDNAEASAFIRFGHLAERNWARHGLDYYSTTKHTKRMHELGFGDIAEHVTRWPLGDWADTPREQEIGRLTLQNFLKFIDMAGETLLTDQNAMSKAEAQEVVRSARDDLNNNCIQKRLYLTMLVNMAPLLYNWFNKGLIFLQHDTYCKETRCWKPISCIVGPWCLSRNKILS